MDDPHFLIGYGGTHWKRKREKEKVNGVRKEYENTCDSIRNNILEMKVDRVRANHSLRLTASQGTSNIPFHWFLLLGYNRQARDHIDFLSFRMPGNLQIIKENSNSQMLILDILWHRK